MRVWTVGHSNREPEAFCDLLAEHAIQRVADIRTVPRSRHNPWTSLEALPGILAARGVAHAHVAALGGLRKPRADSPNGAWRNESFRGYADHMQSAAFEAGLAQVLAWARGERVALMCAEAVPWRCHRNLVADALVARGVDVVEILGPGKAQPHKLTPFARVVDGRVSYPEPGGRQSTLFGTS